MSLDVEGICIWCAYLGLRTPKKELDPQVRAVLQFANPNTRDEERALDGRLGFSIRDLRCHKYPVKEELIDPYMGILPALRDKIDGCPDWMRHLEGESPKAALAEQRRRRSTPRQVPYWLKVLAVAVSVAGGIGGIVWIVLRIINASQPAAPVP